MCHSWCSQGSMWNISLLGLAVLQNLQTLRTKLLILYFRYINTAVSSGNLVKVLQISIRHFTKTDFLQRFDSLWFGSSGWRGVCFRRTHDDGSWWHVACAWNAQHNWPTPVINGWLEERQCACAEACGVLSWEPAQGIAILKICGFYSRQIYGKLKWFYNGFALCL